MLLTGPYVYFPGFSVTRQVAVPVNAMPVCLETPGPLRRKPSVFERSRIVTTAGPALRRNVPPRAAFAPVIEPASVAAADGSAAVPTANCRFMPEPAWGSHWKV